MIKILENGKGRRVRCPFCNTLMEIDEDTDYIITDGNYTFDCPACGRPIVISNVINSRIDVYSMR